MDTDSLYFGLAATKLSDAVSENLKSEFLEKLEKRCGRVHDADADTFFPRTCCRKDMLFDKRGEGLFKEEMIGGEMVALCSKTYVIERDGQIKLSCKGINKKSVRDPMNMMKKVLSTDKRESGINMGFRDCENTIFTYTQKRVGFNYFYCKREIEQDGIHTSPLKMVLTPWPRYNRCIFEEKRENPLGLSHRFLFEMDDLTFASVEHYLAFRCCLFQTNRKTALKIQQLDVSTVAKNAITDPKLGA